MTTPIEPDAAEVREEPAVESVDAAVETANVVPLHTRADPAYQRRIVEALLFASSEPLSVAQIEDCLTDGTDVVSLLQDLQEHYKGRGVTLVEVARKWSFRTADDLSFLLRREAVEQKRLSKAALETLAIIAYHQPATRAEIEEVRGVAVSKGTLDTLMELGWVKMRGRRRVPGSPVTYGTTDDFMSHFGLADIKDLPGLRELKKYVQLKASRMYYTLTCTKAGRMTVCGT
ncbi:MAG: SMC-Scp complex subunit ScpB, partial [Pseudomonadota bacterium]